MGKHYQSYTVDEDGDFKLDSDLLKLLPRLNEHRLRQLLDLQNSFTRNGDYSIWLYWFDPAKYPPKQKVWTLKYVSNYVRHFISKKINDTANDRTYPYREKIQSLEPYKGASKRILAALDEFKIYNKNVAVVGTETPWIEAIALNLNNKVTTVEYNVPILDQELQLAYPDLKVEEYFEFEKKYEKRFDCIISFSSIEHSGLGRYGEPLDPDGDIKTMTAIRNNLKDDGVVVFGAPIGLDAVFWNAARVYGNKRLPLLFAGFKQVGYFFNEKIENIINVKSMPRHRLKQPVIVLQKEL